MRLTERLLAERLHRVRERARSARAALAAERKGAVPVAPQMQLFRTEGPLGRRREARVYTSAEIFLRRLGRPGVEVRLCNVSAKGCEIELMEPVERADHVVARLPGLEPFGATIAWSDGKRVGIAFDRPMHPAVFELLLSRLC